MHNSWIFETDDYRSALEKKLREEGLSRGYRTELARAAGCQLAYISHVLSGRAQFTPDQAIGLCEFWNFDDLETEYFMLLIQEARAATPRLLTRLEKQKALLKREHLKTRRTRLSHEPYDKERVVDYYLDWAVAAIHVALTVPNLREPAALAKHFRIEESRVRAALAVLQDLGFAKKSGSSWQATSQFFHAADESRYARLHHRNWRQQIGEELSRPSAAKDAIHYTAIHSLSAKDFEKIRNILSSAIDESRSIVAPSKEEKVACFAMDWFEI